jgi:endonuclease YncB( thermonuclease family)
MEVPMLGLLFFAAMIGADSATVDAPAVPSLPVRGSVSEYHFQNDIMALKPNDQGVYVLLGSGFLRPTTFGDPKIFISAWLKSHPKAIVTPISRSLSTNRQTHRLMEIVYFWVEDGEDSLNVDLIRAGIFAGGTMYDMVDNEKGLEWLLKNDPKLADARAEIEKEKAAAPQDRDERLISDEDYKVRITRINEAEQFARERKLGIWSGAMKEEREADGIE